MPRAQPENANAAPRAGWGGVAETIGIPNKHHVSTPRHSLNQGRPAEGWSRDPHLIAELGRVKQRIAMERPGAREACVTDFLRHWNQSIADLIEAASVGHLTRQTLSDIETQRAAWLAAEAAFHQWRAAA